jgi:rubrerythrin
MENLVAAAAGKHEEWTEMYPRMAKDAREEGFEDLARMFEGIAAIEKSHQERYQKLLQTVESGAVFDKASQVLWECRNCGHHVENPAAPGACAVCKHPKAFFEITKNNY